MSEINNLLDEGFTPVPLFYGTKVSSVKWTLLTKKRPEAYLRHLFRGLAKNIGIIIKSPLAVLDFDQEAFYHSWAETNPALVNTRTVKTKRGYHCYFYVESGTYPARSKECDVKTNGYMVVPPSKVKNHIYEYVRREPILYVPDMNGLGVDFFHAPVREGVSVEEISLLAEKVDLVDEILSLSRQKYGRCITKNVNSHILCNCPFHSDRNPSLGVWDDHFYCYSTNCIAHKRCDGVDFIALKEECGIGEAMMYIEEYYE